MMPFVRCLLLPVSILLFLSGCKPRGEPELVLIGHIAPLSGSNEQRGEHARQAIALAVAEANSKEGNVIPGLRVAVLHVDSRGELESLQPEAVRLITVNRVVALFGGLNAAQIERLGQAARPYERALMTPAGVPANLWAENVFSINTSPSFRGQVLARFASLKLKAERVAVLIDGRRSSDTAVADAFNREFSKADHQAPRQHVYRSAAGLAKVIDETRDTKPQAILFAGAATDLATVRSLLRGTSLDAPLLFGGDGEELTAADAGASQGVYLTTPYNLDGGTSELQSFVKNYQNQFHEVPDSDALLAYDGVRAMFQALHHAKKPIDAAKVSGELARFLQDPFESLTGPIKFNKDHSARRPLFVVRMENGKMCEPERFEPEGME
jgi:branched-chain amino acid transport system substrate-binding protein